MVKISCKLPLDRNVYETKIFLQLSSMQCNYGIVKKKKKKYRSCCQMGCGILWNLEQFLSTTYKHASLVAQTIKHLPAMWETWVWSVGQEDPLEKEMATHSSTLAWKIPWTEEPGRLQSMWLQRVGHDWAISLTITIQGWSLWLSNVKVKWNRTFWFFALCPQSAFFLWKKN